MPKPSVRIIKRAIDVVGSALGLGLTLPLVPVLAVAIKLDSQGPVFFSQRRAGSLLPRRSHEKHGPPRCTEFTIYKLRTMRMNAEKNTGPVLAAPNDGRVTRLGRLLRKSRLDELPQLWNVLRGDMSLVGPRPERPEILANLALAIPFFEERMRDVKQGPDGYIYVATEQKDGVILRIMPAK